MLASATFHRTVADGSAVQLPEVELQENSCVVTGRTRKVLKNHLTIIPCLIVINCLYIDNTWH
jgi:hypothetical protein